MNKYSQHHSQHCELIQQSDTKQEFGKRGKLVVAGLLSVCLLWLLAPAATLLAQSEAPYPPSPVITGWSWASLEDIARLPQNGSTFAETFALTGGDDEGIYVAYGNGRGFEPQAVANLALGMARIEGRAGSFNGANISVNAQLASGANAPAPSSLLMVDHMLYMWLGNAEGNGTGCQLAWSSDGGGSWRWSNWTFAEFGDCVFINYGPNYEGARDEYIYIVTPDSPASDVVGDVRADSFVLMRVPQEDLGDRAAYEYFASIAPDNTPTWTAEISERGAVFTHVGKAGHSSITYDAGLGRYLWWQEHPATDAEADSVGGIGIYDAPEPWGPWTTAFYKEEWATAPGQSGTFPSKWMSDDGRTVHLAFAGNDLFSVRQAKLTISTEEISTQGAATVATEEVAEEVAEEVPVGATEEITDAIAAVLPDTSIPVTETADTVPGTDENIGGGIGGQQPISPLPEGSASEGSASERRVAEDSTPEWATIPVENTEQDPPDAFNSPLPAPISTPITTPGSTAESTSAPANPAFESPLTSPLDTSGAAAGLPFAPPSQVAETVPTTVTVPATVTQAATTTEPVTDSTAVTDTARLVDQFPITDSRTITDLQILADRDGGTNADGIVPAFPGDPGRETQIDPSMVVPTPVPGAAAPAPATASPLAAIFSAEALIMMLLCLVSVSVSVLGFSALVVTVLYARSQAHTARMQEIAQLRMYRTRDLPLLRGRWRYTR